MGDELIREVEQFLYREARLLDDRRFHEWITLFTDDVRYWMSGRSNRYPKSSKAIAILDPDRYVEDDQTMEDELAILDETKETLAGRVARLDTGMAWAEDPPSRTRHLIANVRVSADERDRYHARANFVVYRNRAGRTDRYVGYYAHVLLRDGDSFRFQSRRSVLDHEALSQGKLSIIL